MSSAGHGSAPVIRKRRWGNSTFGTNYGESQELAANIDPSVWHNVQVVVTTADGMTDSIVWYMAGGNLVGFNGDDGTMVVSVAGLGTTAPFQTPIVAKGRIFIATNGGVSAFTLK